MHQKRESIYESGAYGRMVPDWHESDAPWKAEQILRLLSDHGVWPATVVEVGCGSGRVLAEVSRGLPSLTSALGLDVAPQAIAAAKERHASDKVSFRQGSIDADPTVYDLLLMIDVMEHVDDYLGFMRGLRGHAARFVFHIPLDLSLSALVRDQQIRTRTEVGHLHYFSKATALATVADAGFRVVEARYTDGALSLASGRRGLRTDLGNVARRLAQRVSADVAAKVLGGYSLLVLAEPG